MKKGIIIIICILILGGIITLFVLKDNNYSSNKDLSSPENAAKAIWESLNQKNSQEFYSLSSSELKSKCDKEESLCKETFDSIRKITILSRGNNLFLEPNYRVEINSIEGNQARALIYAPLDTSWPIEIELIKENSEWKNQKIILS